MSDLKTPAVKPSRVLLVLIGLIFLLTAMASPPEADAGYYLRKFCPNLNPGDPNPPAAYAGPQDPWRAGGGTNQGYQASPGDYPGVQSGTFWTEPPAGSGIHTELGTSDLDNSWFYWNGCASTSDNTGIQSESDRSGLTGGYLINKNIEIASWWRLAAPLGDPSKLGASEDVGFRWLVTRYQAQLGYGGTENLSPLVTLNLSKTGASDHDMIEASERHNEYATGMIGSSKWERVTWDSGSLVNEGPARGPLPTYSGQKPGNDNNFIGHWDGNDFAGRLASGMLLRGTCVNLPDGNSKGNGPANCSNVPLQRATIGTIRDTRFVVQDSETPGFSISGSLFSGWRNGSSAISAQSLDDGGGIDLSITQALDPNSGAVYSTLDTRYGSCRYWNSNAPVSNGSGANRISGTWNVYSSQTARFGGSLLWNTGPCSPQVTYSDTINAATALRQGLSQIRTCATDYDEGAGNENPTDYTVGSTTYSSLYSSDSANLACASQNAFVDSVAPPATDPSFSGPMVYDPQWIRGTVSVSGSSADTTRGPDGIAGNADDANSYLGTTMISGASQTGLQRSLNNGAYANYGTWNSTPPGSPTGTQSDTESMDSTSLANGTTVDMRTADFDNAFNIGVSGVVRKKVDNGAPTDLSTEPAGGTGYNSFPVTVRGSDPHSHIYSVNWQLMDSKGTPGGGDDTIVQSGSKTVASVNDDSDTISDSVVINNDNYYLITWVFDQAGNGSGFKVIDPLIDGTPPTLSVTGGSASWYNTDRTITYTAQDANTGVATIDWSVLSGVRPGGVPATKSFSCSSPPCGLAPASMVRSDTFTDEMDLQFSATATDSFSFGANTSAPVSYRVRIDKTPPNLTVTKPANGSTPPGPGVELRSTGSDPALATGAPGSGLATGVFEICSLGSSSCSSGSDWSEINQSSAIPGVDPPYCSNSLTATGGTYSCNLDSSQYANGSYKLRFKGYDAAGNWARSPEISFDIDNAGICPVP